MTRDFRLEDDTLTILKDCNMEIDFYESGTSDKQPDWRKAAKSGDVKHLCFEEGITDIPTCAFLGVKSIVSVSFPESLQRIGAFAFEDCEQLKSVSFPSSVFYIGERAFANTGLQTVLIPSTVKEMEMDAFADCPKLVMAKVEARNSIPEGVFFGCTALNDVALMEGIVSIGDRAFAETNLNVITLPRSTRKIGDSAVDEDTIVRLPETMKAQFTKIPWVDVIWYK